MPLPAFAVPLMLAAGTGGLSVALGPKEEPAWKRFLAGALVGGTLGLGAGVAAAPAVGAKSALTGAGAASSKAALAAQAAQAKGLTAAAAGSAGSGYAAGSAPAAIFAGMNPTLAGLGSTIAANPGTSAMLGLGAASAMLPGGQSGSGGSSFSGPAWWEEQQGSGTGTYYV